MSVQFMLMRHLREEPKLLHYAQHLAVEEVNSSAIFIWFEIYCELIPRVMSVTQYYST